MSKFFAVTASLTCLCMWGCMGCSDEKVTDSGTSIGRHFYMVDDSTIMLDFFNWETVEFYSSYIQGRDEEFRVTGYLAYLVNVNRDTVYKRIDFPKYEMKESIDQVDDDLILYYVQGKNGFSNIIELAAWKFATDKTLSYIDVNSDIAEKSIARWEPTGESAWMAECNDIRWTEGMFRCLDEKNGIILITDENKKNLGSLELKGCGLPECYYNSLRFYGNYIGVGHQIYKMYEDGEIGNMPLFEINFEEFTNGRVVLYPSSGDTIYYSEDNIE